MDLHGVRKPLPSAGRGAVEETKSKGYIFGRLEILGDLTRSCRARIQATLARGNWP